VDRRRNSASQSIATATAGGPVRGPGAERAGGAPGAGAGRGRRAGRSGGTWLLEYALVIAIFLGSLSLWVVVPFGSLFIASKIGNDAQTVVFAALFICPIAMLACGLGLSWLYTQYLRVSGSRPTRDRSAWLGSLSGDRKKQRGRRPILDTSLTISAGTAIVLLLVWFLFLAENYEPAGFLP